MLGCALVLLAITVFSTSFLNFGLAVLLGTLCLIVVDWPQRVMYLTVLLFPSSILLALLLVTSERAYVLEIMQNPSEFNFGIPFFVIQPLFIILLQRQNGGCISGKGKRD